MVEELEQGLQNYARVLQQQTEINVCQMAGGGAAGGMGIAAAVFLNADIKPGIEIVLNAVNLAQAVQGAALVITGKGASTRKRQVVKRRWAWRRWRSSLMSR
ncbi:hypothetical protein ECZU51_09350 [Escherichia coli]|nr:hypothetical protein ECZU51_09350 [Escherichia coli]